MRGESAELYKIKSFESFYPIWVLTGSQLGRGGEQPHIFPDPTASHRPVHSQEEWKHPSKFLGVFLYPEQREGEGTGAQLHQLVPGAHTKLTPARTTTTNTRSDPSHGSQVQITAPVPLLGFTGDGPALPQAPQSHPRQQSLSGVKSREWECWIQEEAAPSSPPSESCSGVESSFACRINKDRSFVWKAAKGRDSTKSFYVAFACSVPF